MKYLCNVYFINSEMELNRCIAMLNIWKKNLDLSYFYFIIMYY